MNIKKGGYNQMFENFQRQTFNNRRSPRINNNPFTLSHSNRSQASNKSNLQSVFKRITSPENVSQMAFKSFGNLNQTLTNVQKVAQVVQSATPLVQEYGPIVKNLPALYRMMKTINNIDEEKVDTKIKANEEKKNVPEHSNELVKRTPGQSTPKLFI